jgi:hypothetical protein
MAELTGFSVADKEDVVTELSKKAMESVNNPSIQNLFQKAIDAVNNLNDTPYHNAGNEFSCTQNGFHGKNGVAGSDGNTPLGFLTIDGDPGKDGEHGEHGTSAGTVVIALVPVPKSDMFLAVQQNNAAALLKLNNDTNLNFVARGGNGGHGGSG